MGATMSRAGRKRKMGAVRGAGWRERSEDPAIMGRWHRARDVFLEIGGDRRMASQAGKMFAARRLSALEVEVVDRWDEMLTENYRIVYNLTRNAHPTALERAGVSLRAEDPERVARFRQRFEAARDAILEAGRPALNALNRLCADEASSSVLPDARRGIAQLVAHWHLT
jgi:hypothetical protein